MAALRECLHINFFEGSGGRHFGRVLICMQSELSPEPAAAVGPIFRVWGDPARPPNLRGPGAAWNGNGGRFALPWIGGVSWPPTGPQPAPYPQRVESRLTVGRLATRIASPFSYGFMPCPLKAYKAAFSAFAGVCPGAPRSNVLLDPCVTSRVVSRLLKARGVPSIFAKVQATQLFCADSW